MKEEIVLSDFVFNPNLCNIRAGDKEVEFSPSEFRLLEYFVKHKNLILTINALKVAINIRGIFIEDRSVRQLIATLRKKLPGDHIKNRRGFGYIFVD